MAATSTTQPPPHVIEECLSVRLLSDGSIIRDPDLEFLPCIHDDGSIEWKDIPFGPPHLSLHLRLYRPKLLPSSSAKLPVLFFFHGGGYCFGTRTWSIFHDCGLRLASSLSAFVISPDYRLAPEHHLPAAMHDGAAALDWLHSDPDPWLVQSADLSRVFVSGESAGGNLVHHLALRSARTDPDRIRIKGFILIMPFFAGVDRTKSESECPSDALLPLDLTDQLWRLALPRGATRDDPMANPFGLGGSELESAALGPLMVVVGERDQLRDRAVEYARRLKEMGKTVELVELKDKEHGFFSLNCWSEDAGDLVRLIGRFMDEHHK